MEKPFEHSFTPDGINPFLDVTGHKEKTHVVVEIDRKRNVMYIHVDGLTVFRLCRAQNIIVEE